MKQTVERERRGAPRGKTVERRPWVRPAIAEEERFQTYALACSEKAPCGIIVPKS